jgi:toxin ParE1/3/4
VNERRVALSPRAEADLETIALWIADHGAPLTALDYVFRIRRYLETLSHFAERGSRHDDVLHGLRIVGFERRVTIAFIVRDNRVEIQRVFYGGQNWRQAFGDD